MPGDQNPFFEIRESPIQGKGGFATHHIPAGTRLIEYAGERITPAESDARYPETPGVRHHTYLFAIDDEMVVDASVNGNAARFLNHSCAPNAQFDMERTALRALRDIEPGDELRVFYPATEWEMVESFECQCQAAGCIGLIKGAAQLPAQALEPHVLSRTVRALLLRREAHGAGTGELQWS